MATTDDIIIERAARALRNRNKAGRMAPRGDDKTGWTGYVDDVRAVLDAIRTPTDAMKASGSRGIYGYLQGLENDWRVETAEDEWSEEAGAAFSAMLGKLLGEEDVALREDSEDVDEPEETEQVEETEEVEDAEDGGRHAAGESDEQDY